MGLANSSRSLRLAPRTNGLSSTPPTSLFSNGRRGTCLSRYRCPPLPAPEPSTNRPPLVEIPDIKRQHSNDSFASFVQYCKRVQLVVHTRAWLPRLSSRDLGGLPEDTSSTMLSRAFPREKLTDPRTSRSLYFSEFLAGRLVHASLAEHPASSIEERQRCPIPASVRCRD